MQSQKTAKGTLYKSGQKKAWKKIVEGEKWQSIERDLMNLKAQL